MGFSLMSAMMIQGNETYVGTYSNKEKTGYGFMIYLMKNGEIHTQIVGTDPYFPFKSKNEAQTAGDELVTAVRKVDLTPQHSGLEKMMGSETTKVVAEVVKGANEPISNP